tara:strand:- start:801 stop:917 length:117 start_codon:yes stop_codon:yes gene_type:complete
VAWAYEAPVEQVAPIKNLIAFYTNKVDIVVDPGSGGTS